VKVANGAQSWTEKCAAIEQLFSELQPADTTAILGIPYSSLIPGIARELLLMAPVPRRKKIAAKKGLQVLTERTSRTLETLDSLSEDGLAALNIQAGALKDLKTKLRILHCVANNAVVERHLSPPRKIQAEKIAWRIGEHYCAITGKEAPTVPTRPMDGRPYGEFVRLLEAIFPILVVDASAASQAKTAYRRALRQQADKKQTI
jgi:hypothetical protein